MATAMSATYLAGFLLCTAAFCLIRCETAEGLSNIPILNADFEAGPSGFTVWYDIDSVWQEASLSSTAAARSGSYGAEVNIYSTKQCTAWDSQLRSARVSLFANQAYTYSLWIKTSVPSTVSLRLSCGTGTAADNCDDTSPVQQYSTSNGWQQLQYQFSPTASSHYQLVLGVCAPSTTIWVDDVSLQALADSRPNAPSYDDEVAGFSVAINSSSGAAASYSLTSPAAAFRGLVGISVSVNAGNTPSDVVLLTDFYNLVNTSYYRLTFWARSDSAARITAGIWLPQPSGPALLLAASNITTTGGWQRYSSASFTPVRPLARLQWAVLAGTSRGTVMMDGFEVEEHKGDPDYFSEDQMSSRIEAHRKGSFSLMLQDQSGQPVNAACVNISLARHDFTFGTVYQNGVVTQRYGAETQSWFDQQTKELFWGLVPGWQFKWPAYEPQPGNIRQQQGLMDQNFFPMIQSGNMSTARGHCLEWLLSTNNWDKFWARTQGCDAYSAALKSRITRDVGYFKGRFTEYDVWNEVVANHGILDSCNLWDSTFPDAFKWAAAADPAARLFINDYGVLEGYNLDKFLDLVTRLQANAAPLGGLGLQAHLPPNSISDSALEYRLSRLADTGLPILISELDFLSGWSGTTPSAANISDDVQAAEYARLLPRFFSHPAISGIMMWGWWDGLHWAENAGIYRMDRSPKPAADLIRRLWQETWTTNINTCSTTATTDGLLPPSSTSSPGALEFRGFYGRYTVTATLPGGEVVAGEVHLSRDGAQATVTLLPQPAGGSS